jgi:hypothetical protein
MFPSTERIATILDTAGHFLHVDHDRCIAQIKLNLVCSFGWNRRDDLSSPDIPAPRGEVNPFPKARPSLKSQRLADGFFVSEPFDPSLSALNHPPTITHNDLAPASHQRKGLSGPITPGTWSSLGVENFASFMEVSANIHEGQFVRTLQMW